MQLGYNQLGKTCAQLGTPCAAVVYYYDRAFPGLSISRSIPNVGVNVKPAPTASVSSGAPVAAIGLNAPATSVSKSAPDARAN